MSGLFITMVWTKHSFWCCLPHTKQLGHLFMCCVHQPWSYTGCLGQLHKGSFTMLGWGKVLWFQKLPNFSKRQLMINKELSSTMSSKWQTWQKLVGWRRYCRGRPKSARMFLFKNSYQNWIRNWSRNCYWKITLSGFTHSIQGSQVRDRAKQKYCYYSNEVDRKPKASKKWEGKRSLLL